MSTVEKLPTGVPGLDGVTYGGIPAGRTTLITGKSGTCKTILALQMASHMATLGHKAMIVAVEEAPQDLITTGDTLGFNMSELIAQGKMVITDLTRPMEGP